MEMNGEESLPEPRQRPPGDSQLGSKLRIGPARTLKPTDYFNGRVWPERGAAVAKVIHGGGRGWGGGGSQ